MLALVLGLGLTAVLVAAIAHRRGIRSEALGAMSGQWVAACNASSQSSSD